MTKVKLSSKNQIVIPKAARKELGLVAGDELVVSVRGGRIELVPRPQSYTQASRGLGREVWRGADAVEYTRGEREAWERKSGA